jgi:hypothetical protein
MIMRNHRNWYQYKRILKSQNKAYPTLEKETAPKTILEAMEDRKFEGVGVDPEYEISQTIIKIKVGRKSNGNQRETKVYHEKELGL